MSAAKIEWTAESAAKLREMRLLWPKLFQKAERRALGTARKALFSTIRNHGNAKYNVPKLAHRQNITVAAHGRRKTDIFGVFANNPKWLTASNDGHGGYTMGWNKSAGRWMTNLQDGEHRPLRDFEYDYLEKRAKRYGVPITATYDRPERAVIDPFAASMVDKFPGWIDSIFVKLLKGGK